MKRLICSRPSRDGVIADRIEVGPDGLVAQPEIGSLVEDGPDRKWRIRTTPLILPYSVRGDPIEVKRVVDARSDWKRW